NTLGKLADNESLPATLRCFEKRLLSSVGYGLPLHYDAQSHSVIAAEKYYQYFPERGFIASLDAEKTNMNYSGASLIALRDEDFSDPATLQDAKRLMRVVLTRYLGDKPLKSRELLM